MSDKDEIKELFQKELGNYEAKVDPSLWQGIQSGISAGVAASTTVLGVGVKVAIGVIATAVITVASIIVYNNVSTQVVADENNKTQRTSKIEPTFIDTMSVKDQPTNYSNSKEPIELEPVVNSNKEELESNVDNGEEEVVINPNSIEDEPKNNEGHLEQDYIANKEQTTEPSVKEEKIEIETTDESSEVLEKDPTLKLYLEPVIAKQDNQYVVFEIKDSNVDNVVWNFGDGEFSRELKTEHFYQNPGDYTVIVKGYKGNNEISKTLRLKVSVEGEFTNLPNGITPNGDNVNDFLFVESKGIKEFQINVMNSRQEVIFQSSDVNFRWDGSLSNGLPAKTGRYVYVIIAKDEQGNTINKYQQLEIKR